MSRLENIFVQMKLSSIHQPTFVFFVSGCIEPRFSRLCSAVQTRTALPLSLVSSPTRRAVASLSPALLTHSLTSCSSTSDGLRVHILRVVGSKKQRQAFCGLQKTVGFVTSLVKFARETIVWSFLLRSTYQPHHSNARANNCQRVGLFQGF